MSKDAFIAAHEKAIEEYMDEHPEADWSEAYHATSVVERANEIYIDRAAAAIDEARDRMKYKGM